jgi:ligand-binding SRPBCC domain-containing protein
LAVFKLTQTIDRPLEEVFNTVIHLEDFPRWSPQNPSARRISEGEIGDGSRFEMEIKGFGLVPQTLEEFERNRRVRVVPHIKQITGGHRFIFTDLGGKTRIDHEMEMNPKGAYRLMLPMMYLVGKRNLKLTVAALKKYLETLGEGSASKRAASSAS